MKVSDLVIPNSIRSHVADRTIIALEGVDACGKSSVCRRLSEHPALDFAEIPAAYVTQPFKSYLYFKASPIANALIFAASLADRMQHISASAKHVISVTDRSLWSTVANNWVLRPDLAQSVLDIYGQISGYVPIPTKTYVLDVPFETCRKRVQEREQYSQKYDEMSRAEYDRHMEFYRWLATQNVNVTLLNPGSKTTEDLSNWILADLQMEAEHGKLY